MTINKQTVSPADSATIRLLRLPLALGVVFIHAGIRASGSEIDFADMDGMSAFRLVVCVITNQLAGLAVPLFFMISGFLFFQHYTEYKTPGGRRGFYKSKLRRRLRTLLVPYVTFNALAVAGLMTAHMAQGHSLAQSIDTYLGGTKWLSNFWDIHTTGSVTNILGIGKPIAYPADSPLWFVRDLMVTMLMSPLIGLAIRRLDTWWLAAMLVLALTGIWIPLAGFGATSCLYFSIGAWFAISATRISRFTSRHSRLILPLAAATLVADIVGDGSAADKYIHIAFILTGMLAVFHLAALSTTRSAISRLLAKEERHPFAGQAAFFVFAVHTLPLVYWGTRPVEWCKQLLWTNSHDGLVCTAQYLGIALLTFALCLGAYGLLRLICPKLLTLLLGR